MSLPRALHPERLLEAARKEPADNDHILYEIVRLDGAIERCRDEREEELYCAVRQALAWARSPLSFDPWRLEAV